jgi:TRAP-type transport system small permease protein
VTVRRMDPQAIEMEPPLAAAPALSARRRAWREAAVRTNAAISSGEESVAVLLFFAMLAGFLVQVFARFVIRYPIPWSEEFCRHVFVWLGALGTAIGVRWGAHFIAFDPSLKLKGWPRHAVVAVVKIFVGVVAAVLLVDGIHFTSEGMTQLTPILNMPAAIANAAIPVSAVLVLWHLIFTWVFGTAGGGFDDMLGIGHKDA